MVSLSIAIASRNAKITVSGSRGDVAPSMWSGSCNRIASFTTILKGNVAHFRTCVRVSVRFTVSYKYCKTRRRYYNIIVCVIANCCKSLYVCMYTAYMLLSSYSSSSMLSSQLGSSFLLPFLPFPRRRCYNFLSLHLSFFTCFNAATTTFTSFSFRLLRNHCIYINISTVQI